MSGETSVAARAGPGIENGRTSGKGNIFGSTTVLGSCGTAGSRGDFDRESPFNVREPGPGVEKGTKSRSCAPQFRPVLRIESTIVAFCTWLDVCMVAEKGGRHSDKREPSPGVENGKTFTTEEKSG